MKTPYALKPSVKASGIIKPAGLALSCLLFAGGCSDGGREITERALEEANAQLAGLQQEVKKLADQQAALQTELQALKQASSKEAEFPELMAVETLDAGLRQSAIEKSREMEAELAKKGLEVTGHGQPKIILPEILRTPYAAEMNLEMTKAGRPVTVPLVVRADWKGHWRLPDAADLISAVESGGRFGAGGQNQLSGNSASAGRFTGPGASNIQPSSPRSLGPNIPGVPVREIDLRGKDLFGPEKP